MRIASIAMAIVLAGCGSAKEKARPRPVSADGVQVLTAGTGPTRVLRYHVAPGTKSLIALALDVDIDAAGQGGPLPTLVMNSELVAEEALPDGSTRIRTTIVDVTARDRPGSPVTAAELAAQTQLMRGLVLRGVLTPQGTLREMKVDTGGRTLPPGLTTQLDTLSKSFEQAAMPLPTTPVGSGASWLHTKTFDQSGMKMTTATTFNLTALEGDLLTFTSSTVVSGKDQTVTQSGTQIELSKIDGKGSGKGTVDLSRMVMVGELVAEFGSDMRVGSETTRMKMKTITRLSPGSPPSDPEAPLDLPEAPLDLREAPLDLPAAPRVPPPAAPRVRRPEAREAAALLRRRSRASGTCSCSYTIGHPTRSGSILPAHAIGRERRCAVRERDGCSTCRRSSLGNGAEERVRARARGT